MVSHGHEGQLKDMPRGLVVGFGLFHYLSFPVEIDLGRVTLLTVWLQCWARNLG